MAYRRPYAGAPLALGLWAGALCFAPSARAGGSLGGDYTTGAGYRGFDAKGLLDLDPKGDWRANASYAYAHAIAPTESRTRQITAGLDHYAGDAWAFRGSLTGWRDEISEVEYLGPSFGFSYAEYGEDGPGSLGPGRDSRILGVSFDSDLFFYQTDVTESSKTVRVSGKPFLIPPLGQRLRLVQLHPNLLVEKPLFEGRATPSISAGHYFYSRDPGIIEGRAGNPRFSASVDSLNGLVGGLFLNSGQIGLKIPLPSHFQLRGALGLEQLASDNTWATTQNLWLDGILFDRLKVSFNWSRTIQDGQRQDLYSGGASYLF